MENRFAFWGLKMAEKATVEQIRARFDGDVERFSSLATGQAVVIDSLVHLELLTEAAAMVTPGAKRALDVGCGAGNYTLKLLERLPGVEVTLVDLSRPMLDRAVARVREATGREAEAVQGDVREVELEEERFDIVMAGQCLHHLRGEEEWRDVFGRVYRCLREGGSFWISDSLEHEMGAVREMMLRRWGEYLVKLNGETCREKVLANVAAEDSPRSVQFQLDLLREVGFGMVDVLHQHNRFASLGAVKG
jgi:tRNA (cmo5U34)-methyltransferase